MKEVEVKIRIHESAYDKLVFRCECSDPMIVPSFADYLGMILEDYVRRMDL